MTGATHPITQRHIPDDWNVIIIHHLLETSQNNILSSQNGRMKEQAGELVNHVILPVVLRLVLTLPVTKAWKSDSKISFIK
jgi:hypothetical protein